MNRIAATVAAVAIAFGLSVAAPAAAEAATRTPVVTATGRAPITSARPAPTTTSGGRCKWGTTSTGHRYVVCVYFRITR